MIYNLIMHGRSIFRQVVAVPQDHGSWVFLFSPLLIGYFASGNLNQAVLELIVAAVTAFLLRQPVSVAVKSLSGRRPRSDLPPALFWIAVYGILLLSAIISLVYSGYIFILYLAIPGLIVFAWHLFLVSKRNERGQAGVEILATGVLALSAPAVFWVSQGFYNPLGWWLWILTWLQSAASIVYTYLRLEQRKLPEMPVVRDRVRMGMRAFLYATFNLCFTLALATTNILSPWIFLPYLLQWAETSWGIITPAIGVKPTKIGVRQLVVSSLFTLLFILVWR